MKISVLTHVLGLAHEISRGLDRGIDPVFWRGPSHGGAEHVLQIAGDPGLKPGYHASYKSIFGLNQYRRAG